MQLDKWVKIRAVEFHVPNVHALLEHANESPEGVNLFLPSAHRFAIDESLLAQIFYGEDEPPRMAMGRVLAVRDEVQGDPRVWLVFEKEEAEPILRLLAQARGGGHPPRRFPRFHTAMPVNVNDGHGWRRAQIEVVSLAGAYLRGACPRKGTRLRVMLDPRHWYSPRLRAEVVYEDAKGEEGVGVKFLPSPKRAQKMLWNVVREASHHR